MGVVFYNIEEIKKSAKSRLKFNISGLVANSVLLILSVALLFVYGSNLSAFLSGTVGFLISVSFTIRYSKKIKNSSYINIDGKIANVYKDNTVHRLFAGYGMWVRREYNHYNVDKVRLTVFLKNKNGENVRSFVLDGVSDEHVSYYENGCEAFHIFGTRFPVRTSIKGERWLCPVCGTFNNMSEKHCGKCKEKIVK